jgi:hypothetical protein
MKKSPNLQFVFWVTVSVLTILASCEKKSPDDGIPPCEQPLNVVQDLFSFIIRDKNNPQIVLLGDQFSQYDTDSIKLYNEDFSINTSFKIIGDGPYFNYIHFPADSIAYEKKISKRFFLALDESDVDTIETEFKLDYIEECFVTQFESLKVYYNDSLYYTSKKTGGYPYLSFFK